VAVATLLVAAHADGGQSSGPAEFGANEVSRGLFELTWGTGAARSFEPAGKSSRSRAARPVSVCVSGGARCTRSERDFMRSRGIVTRCERDFMRSRGIVTRCERDFTRSRAIVTRSGALVPRCAVSSMRCARA
jgi:hypothetical protein